MVKQRSPGPVYALPPTIGYNKHDCSRYRNPQYTISPRLFPPGGFNTPGPHYQVRGINQHGPNKFTGYSIRSRPKPLTPFNPPGPGTYSPEMIPRMKEARPPAYTIQGRLHEGVGGIGPGPCAYGLPSMLGPKVPNKNAAGAYTLTARHFYECVDPNPGPAGYKGINTNIYKNKRPAYTMKLHCGLKDRSRSPGPAAYLPGKLCGELGPRYTCSPQYNDLYVPYITRQDTMSCRGRD